MDRFNIEDFRVTEAFQPAKVKRIRRTFREPHLFIPGPIPARLLLRFRVPAALRVWLALHTRAHMGLAPRLSHDFFAAFGLSKRQAQRGLVELERRQLVKVERQRGRATEVELLPTPATDRDPHRPAAGNATRSRRT